MIARPKISRNEWKPAEIGAFEVWNFALLCCPDDDVDEDDGVEQDEGHEEERRRHREPALEERPADGLGPGVAREDLEEREERLAKGAEVLVAPLVAARRVVGPRAVDLLLVVREPLAARARRHVADEARAVEVVDPEPRRACAGHGRWNAPSGGRFAPLELGRIDVVAADVSTDRVLSAGPFSTVERRRRTRATARASKYDGRPPRGVAPPVAFAHATRPRCASSFVAPLSKWKTPSRPSAWKKSTARIA